MSFLLLLFFVFARLKTTDEKTRRFFCVIPCAAKEKTYRVTWMFYFSFSKFMSAEKLLFEKAFKWKSILLLVVIFYSKRDASDGWTIDFVMKSSSISSDGCPRFRFFFLFPIAFCLVLFVVYSERITYNAMWIIIKMYVFVCECRLKMTCECNKWADFPIKFPNKEQQTKTILILRRRKILFPWCKEKKKDKLILLQNNQHFTFFQSINFRIKIYYYITCLFGHC